jgi:drug/metabolite transporter (DMT)-like permease
MKEPIDTRELIGVGIIFAAAFLMGAFARPPRLEALRLPILFVILAVSVLTFSLLWVALRRRDFAAAVVIAAFSGTLGGLVALFQKVSTSPLARSLSLARGAEPAGRGLSGVAQTLSNPYSLAWILLSVLSMVVIQFAYRRGRAIRIIPAFSASYIVVPVVGGMLVFAETLRPMQWLGIAAIVAGILLLTLKQPPGAAGDAGGESRTRPGAGPP